LSSSLRYNFKINPVDLKEPRARRPHRIDHQSAIQKHVPCLAARLRDQQAAVARCSVQSSIICRGDRVVVGADGITGAQARALQG